MEVCASEKSRDGMNLEEKKRTPSTQFGFPFAFADTPEAHDSSPQHTFSSLHCSLLPQIRSIVASIKKAEHQNGLRRKRGSRGQARFVFSPTFPYGFSWRTPWLSMESDFIPLIKCFGGFGRGRLEDQVLGLILTTFSSCCFVADSAVRLGHEIWLCYMPN